MPEAPTSPSEPSAPEPAAAYAQQPPQPVPGPLVYQWGPGPGYYYQVPGLGQEPMPGWAGKAIGAFVVGVLGIFPLGLILGIQAVVEVGRTRQRGKGLAIAAVVLSSFWTVVAGGLALLLIAYPGALVQPNVDDPSSNSAAAPPGAGLPVDQLALGTCFDVPNGTGGSTYLVNVVPCSGQHDRQLFARDVMSGPYPGLEADKLQSKLDCDRLAYADLVDPMGLEGQNAAIWSYYPEESQWTGGGTPEIWCTIAGYGGGIPLTGDLESAKSHFTALQLAFLDLVRPTAVLRAEVNTINPADWAQGRAIAAQLAAADQAETQLVTGPSATRTVFTGQFQQQAALQLAQDDRVEATDAQVLARSASAQDWTAAFRPLQDDGVPSDLLTIRVNIGLGD